MRAAVKGVGPWALLVAVWTCLGPVVACAGGGPENVLLVVNPDSPASLCIANHYAQWRGVPAENVIYLPWDPSRETVDVGEFRRGLLSQVVAAALSRPSIDAVVYSADFPWAVDFAADLATPRGRGAEDAANRPNPYLSPVGSITGLTYLWRAVEEWARIAPHVPGAPLYTDLTSNRYMRLAIPQQAAAPTLAFGSRLRFGRHGEVLDNGAAGGMSYLLCTMLAVTSGRGNSVDEALACLRAAAAADGSRPKGTIYYVANRDVRSRIRALAFPVAVRQLRELGVAAEILHGDLPRGKPDVQGVTMGRPKFDWGASGSRLLPGALADNLTSAGGVIAAHGYQTPLSEFLRHGAAGACGTVTEPYAIPEKFPSALLHVHYARGCTLAEAFYQSVYAPYQLLIVGDPLCRPWANIPEVRVEGVRAGQTVRGRVELRPLADAEGGPIDRFELFLGGVRRGVCRPGEKLLLQTQPSPLDPAGLPDGWHELRIVAIQSGPIASQGRLVLPIRVENGGYRVELEAAMQAAAEGPSVVADLHAPAAARIELRQNRRLLGVVAGDRGRLSVPVAVVGRGPVRLQAVSLSRDGRPLATSKPAEVVVP